MTAAGLFTTVLDVMFAVLLSRVLGTNALTALVSTYPNSRDNSFLINLLDYDLCTSCIRSGSAESHNPFHEFFEISEPGRVVVHNVFSGRGERETHGSPTRRRPREFSPRVSPAVVHNATCDLCESRIRGARYVCLMLVDRECISDFSLRNVSSVLIMMSASLASRTLDCLVWPFKC